MDPYNNFIDFCYMINGYNYDIVILDDIISDNGSIKSMITTYQDIWGTGCVSSLAPLPVECPQPVPCTNPGKKSSFLQKGGCKKEEQRDQPMAYNDTQSTETTQRNYLLERLSSARYTQRDALVKMFNIYSSNMPKSYKDLIDWIKNDKFTLDAKRTAKIDAAVELDQNYSSPFDGITFTGAPKADNDGYSAAVDEMAKQMTAAKDAIMSGVYADGLKAIQAFEVWLPSNAPAATPAQ